MKKPSPALTPGPLFFSFIFPSPEPALQCLWPYHLCCNNLYPLCYCLLCPDLLPGSGAYGKKGAKAQADRCGGSWVCVCVLGLGLLAIDSYRSGF